MRAVSQTKHLINKIGLGEEERENRLGGGRERECKLAFLKGLVPEDLFPYKYVFDMMHSYV